MIISLHFIWFAFSTPAALVFRNNFWKILRISSRIKLQFVLQIDTSEDYMDTWLLPVAFWKWITPNNVTSLVVQPGQLC